MLYRQVFYGYQIYDPKCVFSSTDLDSTHVVLTKNGVPMKKNTILN